MSKITHAQLKDLPTGADYYATRDEAIAQGGVLAEIVLTKTGRTVYGVFRDQQMLLDHLRLYLHKWLNSKKADPTDLDKIADLYETHLLFSPAKCAALHLPTTALWFDNETGALTAFTLMPTMYGIPTPYLAKACCLKRDDSTPAAFYGVFGDPYAYARFRETIHASYACPRYPFELDTLEYDRCRATLMGVRDALHKAPALKPMSAAELAPFKAAHQIPQADLWFWTKEEALKAAGTTIGWTIADTTLYAVYRNRVSSGVHVTDYVIGMSFEPERKAAAQAGDIKYGVVADPERYGAYPKEDQMPQ